MDDLPAYKPYRKGTVEALNGAVEEMLLVSLPRSPRRARLPAAREDHFMRLPGAQVVSTRALLAARENIRAPIAAQAMICIYGQAGHGKSFAVNASLYELAPKLTRRTLQTGRGDA
ncbi:hypothetical protein [Streptomyces sp. NPDC093225]|uniref:hypothetical protein n=1 Tax=Streptomyces sp. NPDC093225 TaxID=3366034 RepID=UPI003822C7DC